MFNIGDLVVYSTHGICRIDNICERTFLGVTKNYYVLHSIQDNKLSISIPVENEKVTMLELLTKEQAEKILESFKLPGIEWIEVENERNRAYSEKIKKGNRTEVAMIANSLIRKKIELESKGKKMHAKDNKLLNSINGSLFSEMAFSLEITVEEMNERIISFINENED